jgi:SAM-dependent methyltransferase
MIVALLTLEYITNFIARRCLQMDNDARQYAPSAARNRDPIWEVLKPHLPSRGLVLEVASGSGEHTVHFARASNSELIYQPSDPNPLARASIDAWAEASGLANIRPSIALDAAADVWPIERADVVICINMIHISPWSSTVGLMRGAGRMLPAGGLLFLYGPYRREGQHMAPSNEEFDRDLRRRNPEWGVRDLEGVADLASQSGFGPPAIAQMPANNLSLLFRRTA